MIYAQSSLYLSITSYPANNNAPNLSKEKKSYLFDPKKSPKELNTHPKPSIRSKSTEVDGKSEIPNSKSEKKKIQSFFNAILQK
jgi:hypothetical protein